MNLKKWLINGLAVTMASAMTILAVGCGDDDKGNNSGTELTEEEQYALSQQILVASPRLVVQNFGSQFWDGVDPEDFTFDFFGLGKLVPPRLAKRLPDALMKPMQLEADTVIYDYSNGWWKFHVEFALDDDTAGISVSILLDDSVQFLTAAETPQIAPNDLTVTFVHQGEMTLEVAIDGDSLGTFGVGLAGENNFIVNELNEPNVTIFGATNASIDFSVANDSIEAAIFMAFNGLVDGVVTANEPESCPDDGNITIGFEMDFEVTEGDEYVEAAGEW
jgi:hypothetical protein